MQTTITDGIKMLVARHAATEGCEVGNKALATVKKISNADPSEGVWAGTPKVLYLSSLKKNVIEYEEDGDQYSIKKDASGNNIPAHFARVGGDENAAETPLRKAIMQKATVGDIIDYLAGKTLKVSHIMGPYKTSRLKAKTDAMGRRDGYEVVGLRNTSIPVFEEVK